MNNNHNVRGERALSNLLHLAGAYIAMEAGRTTLITPTRVDISPDRKNAIIFVSVFPDTESENAIKFLARHRDTFRQYLKQHGRFAILPFIKWELDYGEKNRQRLDEISKEMGTPSEFGVPALEDIDPDEEVEDIKETI